MYWFSLALIPVLIINRIRGRIINFLWEGAMKNVHKIHLLSWDKISREKSLGRWGIQNIFWFNIALVLKTVWRGLMGKGSWSEILFAKYLKTNLSWNG
jgi:hypothetical protein